MAGQQTTKNPHKRDQQLRENAKPLRRNLRLLVVRLTPDDVWNIFWPNVNAAAFKTRRSMLVLV